MQWNALRSKAKIKMTVKTRNSIQNLPSFFRLQMGKTHENTKHEQCELLMSSMEITIGCIWIVNACCCCCSWEFVLCLWPFFRCNHLRLAVSRFVASQPATNVTHLLNVLLIFVDVCSNSSISRILVSNLWALCQLLSIFKWHPTKMYNNFLFQWPRQ